MENFIVPLLILLIAFFAGSFFIGLGFGVVVAKGTEPDSPMPGVAIIFENKKPATFWFVMVLYAILSIVFGCVLLDEWGIIDVPFVNSV